MKKDIILFDLDGTVADSSKGIYDCVRYALSKYGIEEPDDDKLKHFVGPPLTKGFADHCPELTPEEINSCVAFYREKYKTEGVFACSLYSGIKELLRDLHAAGKCVVIATLKPEHFAKQMVEHLGVLPYLSGVNGVDFAGTISTKCQVIENSLKSLGVNDLSRCVMIGDRMSDAVGAHKAGMDAIGVLFGFGGEDEFSGMTVWKIARDVEELRKILLKNT